MATLGAVLRLAAMGLGILGVGLVALLSHWTCRGNRAQVDPGLELESWDVVSDGRHNSNTDLLFWRGRFHLVHAASPFHFGTTRSRLVVLRSADARHWDRIAELRIPGRDVRDPKLAPVGDQLFLFALANEGLAATPERTLLATSGDGQRWTPFEPVGPEGWLFWRPKTRDGRTWYVPAYWKEHGASILLRSDDGRHWRQVSQIHEGDGTDETAIEFLPDGRLLATARLEVTPDTLLGNDEAATLLAVAAPPYARWTRRRSRVTRLDGPVLFSHAGRVFAIARFQPDPLGGLTRLGGVFSRKRTALYRVDEERLVHLSDLPSAGDTSYAGVALRDGFLYVDYYTSRIDRDYPWLLGMLLPTDVRMARIPVRALEALAARKAEASGAGLR